MTADPAPGWREQPLDALLARHGLAGLPEVPFPTDGWSGAYFTSISRGSERFVLKRTSPDIDWIAAATRDFDVREACIAALPAALAQSWLPVRYLGAAIDGKEAAILMPDLSVELIAWERPAHESTVDAATIDRVLDAAGRLHALAYPRVQAATLFGSPVERPFPWCPLPERLLLTSRPMCERHIASGIPAGMASAERLLAGWDAFDRLAPVAAQELVADLSADPEPLLRTLATLPAVPLHGDLKLANVALIEEVEVAFIDWAMTIRAPVAVELGWFLVVNSASLPIPPDAALRRYRELLGRRLEQEPVWRGRPATEAVIGDWRLQVDCAMLVGLLLRGWRKGLDTAAGSTLASGVSAADDLAWWCDSAIEAAGRVL